VGAQGSTELGGIAGPAGATGAAGPQGAIGPIGAQGPIVGNGSWNAYRDYTFNTNSNEILRSDSGKARDPATWIRIRPAVSASTAPTSVASGSFVTR
jgi:hypothetical protein